MSMRTRHAWSWMDDLVPFVTMLMVTCVNMVVLNTVKATMNDGMGSFVYVMYHNALGTFILLPFFIVHIIRKVDRPPLTLHILFRFFVLSLLGICLFQALWFLGVDYSSPTMASAIGNMAPGITFLIAVIFRTEKLDIRSSNSVAKLLGTIMAILGATVFTFYQGPRIFHTIGSPNQLFLLEPSKWIFGSLITLISVTFSCMYTVLLLLYSDGVETKTAREYPDQQSIVFFYCLFGTIQCMALSPLLEQNRSAWVLPPRSGVTTVVFGAVHSAVVNTSILTWCVGKKGPVYAAMFSPLSIVLAVIMGVTFLGDSLHLGSVIGGTIVAAGFYTVMWGHIKEKNMIPVVKDDNLNDSYAPRSSVDQTAPLLSSINESKC